MQILKNYKARLAAAALGILCAAAAPLAAHAQDFPTQPVKIVVPFPAGGTTDILARQMAKELGERWGKPVIVDNKAGASGTIFSEQLARMPADGHTLMLTATHHVINPGLYKNLKYDTRTDFTPLAQVAAVPNVLVVHPSFPPKTVQQLVAYAKANPGKVNFGSSGTGGANHLSGELFKLMAGVEMVHVPYKGAANEGGRFVADGAIAPGGQLPVNTSGGGLSYCHPGMFGIFVLIEAVRQLRGEAGRRQVAGCDTAIAHGNGGTLSSQSTVILGTQATL